MPMYAIAGPGGESKDVEPTNTFPPGATPSPMIALSAVAMTFESAMKPIVLRDVVERLALTSVVVASIFSGAPGFKSTAYTRKTSWFRTSSWRLTVSSFMTPGASSVTRPEMMIGWLKFVNAARLMSQAKELGVINTPTLLFELGHL